MNKSYAIRWSQLYFWLLLSVSVGAAENSVAKHEGLNVFATVDGYQISAELYDEMVRQEVRKRYYHGRISEEKYLLLKQEVGQRLIDNALLMLEGERFRLVPDANKVDKFVSSVSERLGTMKLEQQQVLLGNVRHQFETRERIRMLESKVRSSIQITEASIKDYYEKNTEKFTVPLERKVSLILIRVSPGSLQVEWSKAEEQLTKIRKQVFNGVLFSDLAREYSNDQSAQSGGDMGFLHQGMLNEDVEAALDKLTVGTLSQPIRVLEGYVLVRVNEIKASFLQPYEVVKGRAYKLYSSHLSEKTWLDYMQVLRDKAVILQSASQSVLMSR